MATRNGATKTVGGKRYRYNNGRWTQIKASGNVSPTSSRNRSARSGQSNATVSNDSNRSSRGGVRTTTDTQRTSTGSARVTGGSKGALPPGTKGGDLATTNNRPRRRNINGNPSSSTTRTGTTRTSRVSGSTPPKRLTGSKPIRGGGLLGPLSVGMTVADLMTRYLPQNTSTSGRGSGRAAFNGSGKPNKPSSNSSSSSSSSGSSGRGSGRAAFNGNGTSTKPTKPARRGMSNIPPAEGLVNNPLYGKPGNPNSANRSAPPRTVNNGAGSAGGGRRNGKPAKTARKPQSKDMNANYRAWAAANPELAKKVKKGQAGYEAINSKPSSKSNQPKNAGAGNGAPGAQSRSPRSTSAAREAVKNGIRQGRAADKSIAKVVKPPKKKKKAASASNANDSGFFR